VTSVSVATTTTLMNSLGAFGFLPNSLDSAMLTTLPVGSYTSQVSGVGGVTGVALAEVYDNDPGIPSARLINISARCQVGTGFNILVAGLGISGNTSERVLLRGVGPGLTSVFGLPGTMTNPQLSLYDSTGTLIASNTGWSSPPTPGTSSVVAVLQQASATVMQNVGAFPLVAGSTDAAMLVTLPPGDYTAQLAGVGGTTGIGLVEVYEAP
jgi:hypothetical protein